MVHTFFYSVFCSNLTFHFAFFENQITIQTFGDSTGMISELSYFLWISETLNTMVSKHNVINIFFKLLTGAAGENFCDFLVKMSMFD